MGTKIKFLALAFVVSLMASGCATPDTKDPPVVITKNVVIVPKLDDEFTTIPDSVAFPNLDTATQKDVAGWLILNEKRIAILESRILTFKNILPAIVAKENLKEGDYRILELGKDDLQPPK